jgi:hypothetical protein
MRPRIPDALVEGSPGPDATEQPTGVGAVQQRVPLASRLERELDSLSDGVGEKICAGGLQRVSGTGQDRDEDVVSRRSNDLQRASSFGLVRPFISAEAFVLGGEYHLAVHGARANDDQANQADPTRRAHVSHGLEAYRRRNRVAFTVTIYAPARARPKIEPVNLPRTPGCQPRGLDVATNARCTHVVQVITRGADSGSAVQEWGF